MERKEKDSENKDQREADKLKRKGTGKRNPQ